MNIFKYPKKEDWPALTRRSVIEKEALDDVVKTILIEVKERRDQALFDFSRKFDSVKLIELEVTKEEINNSHDAVVDDLKVAIELAKRNIEKFHNSQKEKEQAVETVPGVKCWRKSVAIEKVGLYIPGGSAPLFSTILMLGIPAKLAGCREIILCTPPNKNGEINPAILFTADLVGISKIYKVGGAQAIAAMAYGTESIPQVYKIFGPGNQYVTKAKELVQQGGVAIDMPAGPSEVLIVADETSKPKYVAADLLSQAEHGADSQVILLSNDEKVLKASLNELEKQLDKLPRKKIAKEALKNSRAILLNDLDDCIGFSNQYAPEHLIIASEKASMFVNKIINAGSVFLGNYSCESAGDYASGTNHTLPTNGYAKNYSGVSLDSFYKKITFQELSREGIQNIGPAIELMAEAEGLYAHKNAVSLRLNDLGYENDDLENHSIQIQNRKSKINEMARTNIQTLEPYSSARDEFSGTEGVFLDANENPFGTLNRYPDPYQRALKSKLAEIKMIPTERIFIGNGSDEVIDLAFRIFCCPGKDKALTFSPTYGMYDVSAAINQVELIKVALKEDFQIDLEVVNHYLNDACLKLMFICSPNNPTGNCLEKKDIEYILNHFNGIVIIDEAYIDFSLSQSWVSVLNEYSNLVICQTFSKAWGLAAARVGVAYANEEIIQLLNKVKPPYNVSEPNQKAALGALINTDGFEKNKRRILEEKARLENALDEVEKVVKVYPSETNFLLVEFENAERIYQELVAEKVITRNRNRLVKNCIRITVGTSAENERLIKALKKISK